MKTPLIGFVGALIALGGCAAAGDDAASTRSNDPALIGSYPTKNGGKLEIFEPEPGQFLIGELSFDDDDGLVPTQPKSGARADATDTLAALYERMVGAPVPAELRAADVRRRAASSGTSSETARAPSFASEAEHYAAGADTLVEKAADRDVAGFKTNFCRVNYQWAGSDGCQSFNYCRTEITNDTTIREGGLFGAYSVVRPYRGTATMEVLYNDVLSFSRTIGEGGRYRAWKAVESDNARIASQVGRGGPPPFTLETRVRYAEGNGYHIAVLGTRERKYWTAYSSEAEQNDTIGCAHSAPPASAAGAGPAIVSR